MGLIWVTSDLHSDLEKIAEAAQNKGDAWLDLGDQHDKTLEESPFYEHTKFVLSHPSTKRITYVITAIQNLQEEYEQPTEEFKNKLKALIEDPETKKQVTQFAKDFTAYIAKERKTLDEAFAKYKKPKYRVLGNHDPAIKSEQAALIHNTIQDINGIMVAGSTANCEATHASQLVSAINPYFYAHLQDFAPINKDSELEKITLETLRENSRSFNALEGKDYDVLALHAPIFEKYAYNEHDESSVFDASMAKLVQTAKKKPQIVIWGHAHNEYASMWKKDRIIYARVGPHRQLGLEFDNNKKLKNIVVKQYGCSPKEMCA